MLSPEPSEPIRPRLLGCNVRPTFCQHSSNKILWLSLQKLYISCIMCRDVRGYSVCLRFHSALTTAVLVCCSWFDLHLIALTIYNQIDHSWINTIVRSFDYTQLFNAISRKIITLPATDAAQKSSFLFGLTWNLIVTCQLPFYSLPKKLVRFYQ